MENEALDINHLNKWLGNIETVTDYLTPIVEQRYRATLNIDPGDPKLGRMQPRFALDVRLEFKKK